tara:strand:- start:356 stop:1438 length:1083 start_codon:yes stop_codon:yes gene_type:complete
MNESTETDMGIEESNATITSAEDKFFGVKTQIVKKSKEKEALSESDDFDLEIVDDKPPVNKAAYEPTGDEELDSYSASVRKRLDKATFKRREAERLAEEAVTAAQQLNQQNQSLSAKNKEYESLINRGETALVSQIKQKAQLAAEKAKAEYKKAHEEGNTDDIVSSQERMIEAQSQMQEAERYERSLPQQPTQQQQMAQQQLAYQQQQQAYQQQQQQSVNSVPAPEPKAKEWGEKNTWFGDEEHKGMTAYAYALHEEAIKDNGLSPNSDQYFEYIDGGMRGRFSEYEWSENTSKDVSGGGQTAPSTAARPSSVVAPSARNNGAKPRKMKLTSSQVSLAKRLGLTNAQYANQLVKEMTNGR